MNVLYYINWNVILYKKSSYDTSVTVKETKRYGPNWNVITEGKVREEPKRFLFRTWSPSTGVSPAPTWRSRALTPPETGISKKPTAGGGRGGDAAEEGRREEEEEEEMRTVAQEMRDRRLVVRVRVFGGGGRPGTTGGEGSAPEETIAIAGLTLRWPCV